MTKAVDNLNLSPAQSVDDKRQVSNDEFVELVQSNYSVYVAKCYSYLKCTSLAEDAVQEGILAAHTNLSLVRNPESLGAWLYRIIVRKAIEQLRRNQKFPKTEDSSKELVTFNEYGLLNAPLWAGISNPEEEVLKAEGLTHVKQAMEALDDTYRIPILLKDYEGFSISEISELMGISKANVKVRVHRGRIKLRSELSDYFFPNGKKAPK